MEILTGAAARKTAATGRVNLAESVAAALRGVVVQMLLLFALAGVGVRDSAVRAKMSESLAASRVVATFS